MDKDVEAAVRALERWRIRLAVGDAGALASSPLEAHRAVAGKRAREQLLSRPPSAHELPLRDALVPWIEELTVARVSRDQDVACAEAYVVARAPVRLAGSAGTPTATARELVHGALAAPSAAEARVHLDALAKLGHGLKDAEQQRAELRHELYLRLDIDDPTAHFVVPRAPLEEALVAFLDASDDVARELLRNKAREKRPLALDLSLASDAKEGWPTKLGPRWFADLFGKHTRGLAIELPPLPEAVGASSFALALHRFGFALRRASAGRGVPFALRDRVRFVDAHRHGALFASLLATEPFHRRALGVGSQVADAQARSLGVALLFAARRLAVRWLLVRGGAFDELSERAFGEALPAALVGALLRPADDDDALAAALLTTVPLAEELRDRFDEDWFRSPRAFEHLRARSTVPLAEEAPTKDSAVLLARFFEGLIR